jgi:hypothetical protein
MLLISKHKSVDADYDPNRFSFLFSERREKRREVMASPSKCGFCDRRGHKATNCHLRNMAQYPAHAFTIKVLEKFEEFGRQLRKRVRLGAVNPNDIDLIVPGQIENLNENMGEWRQRRSQYLKEHPFVPATVVAAERMDKLAMLLRTGLTVNSEVLRTPVPEKAKLEETPKKKDKDKKAESESEEEVEEEEAEEDDEQ